MFILRDLLSLLQLQFSETKQGRRRSIWFSYTLLAIIVPFTSSITSNLLRSLNTLFGSQYRCSASIPLWGVRLSLGRGCGAHSGG